MFRKTFLKLALLLSLTLPSTVNATDLTSLQQQIAKADGWKAFAPVIIVLQGGGSCSCELRDPETGVCQLWVCGNQDAKRPWGPVRVQRPVLTK